MMEVRDFVRGIKQSLDEVSQLPRYNILGSAADRAALLRDLEQARLEEPNLASEEHEMLQELLEAKAGCPPLPVLQEEFQRLLGSKDHGALLRSAEASIVLLRSWPIQHGPSLFEAQRIEGHSQSTAQDGTEQLLETTTRPCPRCFVAIEKEGGCQHMTCSNPRCRHEFCWLCLRDWKSPGHDGLQCALRRLEGASNEEVLADIEAQIPRNWAAQDESTRPSRKEDYAVEVRQRFQSALTTRLASDEELLRSTEGTEADPLLLSLRLLRFYDRAEQRLRRVANDNSREGLCSGLAWLRQRWWLRLDPEEAVAVGLEHEGAGETVANILWRSERIGAEHAVRCLEEREKAEAKERLLSSILPRRFLGHFGHQGPHLSERPDKLLLQRHLVGMLEGLEAELPSMKTKATSAAQRALSLAKAARESWQANIVLELTGHLPPASGSYAQSAALAGERWAHALQDRGRHLQTLLAKGLETPAADEMIWEMEVSTATELLNEARRCVFKLALEYCGGTRRTVRRRGER